MGEVLNVPKLEDLKYLDLTPDVDCQVELTHFYV